MLAPVVLFVYNRAEHTRKTLEALAKNLLADNSTLYIYSDGPKADASIETLNKIKEVRALIRERSWCKEVIIQDSDSNLGLTNSILKGVSEVVNEHGKIIVLEDDIVTSVGFLKYMNDALNVYETEEKVMHISGYNYPIHFKVDESTFFMKILTSWGWATWKRAWAKYNHDIEDPFARLNSKRKINQFNINGQGDFYDQLLENKKGNIYTWAVRWYASWYFEGGYSLFPERSLVRNIGMDSSGIHCMTTDIFDSEAVEKIDVYKVKITENWKAKRQLSAYYKHKFHNIVPGTDSLTYAFKKVLKKYLPSPIMAVFRTFR